MARKEIPENPGREDPKFGMKPTGHTIPTMHGYGPSADDGSLDFRVQDCGHKAGGQFSTPFEMDEEDLPAKPDCARNRQGF